MFNFLTTAHQVTAHQAGITKANTDIDSQIKTLQSGSMPNAILSRTRSFKMLDAQSAAKSQGDTLTTRSSIRTTIITRMRIVAVFFLPPARCQFWAGTVLLGIFSGCMVPARQRRRAQRAIFQTVKPRRRREPAAGMRRVVLLP